MEIEDNTINKDFMDLDVGTCFVFYASYYMKIRIAEYNGYTSGYEYKYVALDLITGLTTEMKKDEKVRVVKGKLIIS